MSAKEKICVICGEDCSRQRRVKDKHGRYYHRKCLDRAKKERRAAKAAAAEIPQPPEEPGSYAPTRSRPDRTAPIVVERRDIGGREEADPYALDSGASAEHGGPKTDAATVDAGPMKPCPHCNRPIPAVAMVCANCGFNLSTGQKPVASFAEMAAARVGELGGGTIWPKVIGIMSILIGVGGLVFYGLQLLGTLRERGAGGIWPISLIVATSLGALLALLLLPAGIGLFQRSQIVTVRLRYWAIVKIVLSILFVGYVFGGTVLMDGMAADVDSAFGTTAVEGGVGALVGPALAFLAWLMLWPVVLLFWFGRDRIQKHIGEWR